MSGSFGKEAAKRKKVLNAIKAGLGKVAFIIFLPFFLAFILVNKLSSKISNFLKPKLSKSMTALRAVAAAVRGSRADSTGNEKLDKIIATTGFIYDSEQDIFYSDMDAWQRNFGYCRLYDEACAPLGMIVDCEPIYFSYGGREWLIEVWKGQYDLTTGCEIGVYATDGPILNIPGIFNGTFYHCVGDEDRLQMSYSLKKNNKVLFVRADTHWWITGFKVGEFSQPSELSVTVNITFKSKGMCRAFIRGLLEAGYSEEEIKVYGYTVGFEFDKPKTPQPLTRTRFTDWIIQKKNKYLCDKYQEITGKDKTIQEKLAHLEENAPKLLERIVSVGKIKKVFKIYKKYISSYFDMVRF